MDAVEKETKEVCECSVNVLKRPVLSLFLSVGVASYWSIGGPSVMIIFSCLAIVFVSGGTTPLH